MTELPQITHLQFVVLSLLRGGVTAGHVLRQELTDRGYDQSGPAFYQLMQRLEAQFYVAGEYQGVRAGTRATREKHYKLTDIGARELTKVLEFYHSYAI